MEGGGPTNPGLEGNHKKRGSPAAGREVFHAGDGLCTEAQSQGQAGKGQGPSLSCLLDSVTMPSSCCIYFISKKIPESRVASYQLSNSSVCPQAGVM